MLTVAVAILAASISGLLCWRRGAHAGVNFLLVCGILQAPAVTVARSSAFAVADDASAGVLVAWALVVALRHRSKIGTVALVLLGVCASLAAIALVRSPDTGIGIAQARQVAIPVGLVFTGLVLRARVRWACVLRWTTALALIASVYSIGEWIIGAPLLNPTYYAVEYQGADPVSLRDDLPSAYVSDTPAGTIARSGGPFLNPPSLGFFLASGVVATLLWGYLLPLVLLVAGLAAAFARAGIVISGFASVVAWAWQLVGKWVFTVMIVASGLALTVLFWRQGNTASHAHGLVSGLQYAITQPQGQGFGRTGYQAALANGDADVGIGAESLLGLYFVWLGLPALVLVVVVLLHLSRTLLRQRLGATQTWAAIGVLVGAAASETASSLSATAFLWLLCGVTLGEHDLRRAPPHSTWKDIDFARRKAFSRRGRQKLRPARAAE